MLLREKLNDLTEEEHARRNAWFNQLHSCRGAGGFSESEMREYSGLTQKRWRGCRDATGDQ